MTIFKTFLLGATLSFGVSGMIVAEEVTGNTVVAVVGDTEITIGHMIAMGATLPEADRNLPIDVVFDGILERLIQQEAIGQSQKPAKLTRLKVENERRSLLASDVVNGLAANVNVTPDAVQAAYDRRFSNFTPEPEFNASHILLKTEEDAIAVLEILNNGADFAETAKLKSTGPTGPGGGSLGWFALGRMVPEFEAVITAMEKGDVSAPVETKFGWHVIKLIDKRQPNVPLFEDMREELENEVWREMLQQQIDGLIDAAEISRNDVSGIDPIVLGDFSLIQD